MAAQKKNSTRSMLLAAAVDWMAPAAGATGHLQSATVSAGFWNFASVALTKFATHMVDPTGVATAVTTAGVSTAAEMLGQLDQ